MSTSTLTPTPTDDAIARSYRAPVGPLAGSGPRASDERVIDRAVRDAATRATVAVGLGGVVAIHAVDAVGKWTETRYIFWMYVAAMLAAIGAAGWTLFTRSRVALLAAAGVAGSVLAGYVINRTVGMPNATDDIGNWTEPLGLTSMVVEAATVMVALGAYRVGARRGR